MIEAFIDYLRHEKNSSELTCHRYEQSLRDFQEYFQKRDERITWASVDADIIRGWMENLMDRGCKASTVGTNLSALRSLYRFALKRQIVEHDPARNILAPKKEKPLPQYMREAEMDRLIDGEKDSEKEKEEDFLHVRARTIIILLYETGLRRAELTSLNDNDVDLQAGQLKVTGKRNKQRIIPFGTELAQQLCQYKAIRDKEVAREDNALFVTPKGKRITGYQVYTIVRQELTKVTTMQKRSPHVLRHSFATAMLNHDAGLESVRQLLGHQSIETTQIYTHTTFEQLRRVYKEAHPRGENKKPDSLT